MAQRGDQAHEVKFCCSICLDLLKDPVTVPCGHNYCMSCIKSSWDQEDQKKSPSCPQCRQIFTPRPVLVKNTLLAEFVEERKKTGLQAAAAGHCYAGPEDVACDVCTGRRLKAFKSCLVCVASYCENHLQPHYESPAFKKHKLVDPSEKLQENMCSRHDEVMKMFCRTDQQCICYLCSVDEHKGHDTVSAAAERTERQQELAGSRQRVQQRIQERQREVELLQQEVEAVNRSADEAVEDSEKMFSELKQQVRTQQRTEVSRVKELQEELRQEITELKRKDAQMEKLSRTDDHTQFLHSYPSLSQLTEPADSPRPKTNGLRYFEDVTAALKAARDQIQALLPETRPSGEPTTRAEFLQYSHHITLDPNTARCDLVLSKKNRKVTFKRNNAPYPQHPDRFMDRRQVLSKDGLTGRCYWEVEMKVSRYVDVAVAYKSIDRREGSESEFGQNNKSWSLRWCGGDGYTFIHDKHSLSISAPRSSRVGVYLDHRAGILSFYSVSETMTLLHRVQTTFTEPLFAGLGLYPGLLGYGCSAELCKLK